MIAAGAVGLAGLAVQGVIGGSGGGPASAAGALPSAGSDTAVAMLRAGPLHVVAEPGDTLWSIAEEHHGTSGFRSYLDTLIQLNGGTAIQAGQAVRLP